MIKCNKLAFCVELEPYFELRLAEVSLWAFLFHQCLAAFVSMFTREHCLTSRAPSIIVPRLLSSGLEIGI